MVRNSHSSILGDKMLTIPILLAVAFGYFLMPRIVGFVAGLVGRGQ